MSTNPTLVVNQTPQNSGKSAQELAPSVLTELGLYSPEAVDRLCTEEGRKEFVLQGLISRSSLNLAAGDSGLGKSPLFYQLGLCVAAGVPWLGIPVAKGTVTYIDFENGEMESKALRDVIVGHLGLEVCPKNFLTHYGHEFDSKKLASLAEKVQPALVIIDTLRAYDPAFEKDNTQAGATLKAFRNIALKYGTAFLFVHHVKKPGENGVACL
jgi:RecA-family ATPase